MKNTQVRIIASVVIGTAVAAGGCANDRNANPTSQSQPSATTSESSAKANPSSAADGSKTGDATIVVTGCLQPGPAAESYILTNATEAVVGPSMPGRLGQSAARSSSSPNSPTGTGPRSYRLVPLRRGTDVLSGLVGQWVEVRGATAAVGPADANLNPRPESDTNTSPPGAAPRRDQAKAPETTTTSGGSTGRGTGTSGSAGNQGGSNRDALQNTLESARSSGGGMLPLTFQQVTVISKTCQ